MNQGCIADPSLIFRCGGVRLRLLESGHKCAAASCTQHSCATVFLVPTATLCRCLQQLEDCVGMRTDSASLQ